MLHPSAFAVFKVPGGFNRTFLPLWEYSTSNRAWMAAAHPMGPMHLNPRKSDDDVHDGDDLVTGQDMPSGS